MNILLWGVHPFSSTGLGKVTRLLAKALIASGHRVICIAYQQGRFGRQQAPYPIIPAEGVENLDQSLFFHCKQEKIDLIISIGDIWNCLPIYHLTRNLRTPWIAYFGSEGITFPRRVNHPKMEINISQILQGTSAIWGYTEHTLDALEHIDVPKHVLHHAVDAEEIRKAPKIDLHTLFGIKTQIYLYVGDNNYRKGLDLFVEYIISRTDAVGILCCPIKKAEVGYNLPEMAAIAGDQIILLPELLNALKKPQLDDADIYGLYKGCDFYLHPHCAEGFGLTPLEALFAGAKVAATDTGGPKVYLPTGAKIPTQATASWLQMGEVGYWVHKPDLNPQRGYLTFTNDDFAEGLGKYFDYPHFRKCLNNLLAQGYKPNSQIRIN